ncbi:hypothetical protein CWC22_022020 [Pseudoalteromonas rubra]|uniref:PKD domain-containing protein n=1 Tax=Pseudoalteromonas rubra TaxID=43658 RepID=A0A5S3UW02_9GAMM|nr:PKD domain-containing protein [Pseudoalteromonas rubra]QPB85687.1 hypothetical protein CWC22_022020 [Pseudoalteromonas rubra]
MNLKLLLISGLVLMNTACSSDDNTPEPQPDNNAGEEQNPTTDKDTDKDTDQDADKDTDQDSDKDTDTDPVPDPELPALIFDFSSQGKFSSITADVGSPVTFQGTLNRDDSDITSCQLDFNGDGIFDHDLTSCSEFTVNNTYDTPGVYAVTAKANFADGTAGSQMLLVTINGNISLRAHVSANTASYGYLDTVQDINKIIIDDGATLRFDITSQFELASILVSYNGKQVEVDTSSKRFTFPAFEMQEETHLLATIKDKNGQTALLSLPMYPNNRPVVEEFTINGQDLIAADNFTIDAQSTLAFAAKCSDDNGDCRLSLKLEDEIVHTSDTNSLQYTKVPPVTATKAHIQAEDELGSTSLSAVNLRLINKNDAWEKAADFDASSVHSMDGNYIYYYRQTEDSRFISQFSISEAHSIDLLNVPQGFEVDSTIVRKDNMLYFSISNQTEKQYTTYKVDTADLSANIIANYFLTSASDNYLLLRTSHEQKENALPYLYSISDDELTALTWPDYTYWCDAYSDGFFVNNAGTVYYQNSCQQYDGAQVRHFESFKFKAIGGEWTDVALDLSGARRIEFMDGYYVVLTSPFDQFSTDPNYSLYFFDSESHAQLAVSSYNTGSTDLSHYHSPNRQWFTFEHDDKVWRFSKSSGLEQVSLLNEPTAPLAAADNGEVVLKYKAQESDGSSSYFIVKDNQNQVFSENLGTPHSVENTWLWITDRAIYTNK